jgi:colicin import membrane protein
MSAAAMHSSVLVPQAPGGLGAGAALALVVHAALIVALTLGVDWRTHDPEPVSAELWAAVPQAAAPPAPEPAPAPPTPAPAPAPAPAPPPAAAAPTPAPDIALERDRERQRRAEAEQKAAADRKAAAARAEEDRRQREAQAAAAKAAAEEKAAEDRLARQREENLRRMLGQAGAVAGSGGVTSTGTAAQAAAPSAAYQGRVKAAILPNIVYTGKAPAKAIAEVEVTLAPGGTIISRRLVKRSGHPDWDEAVLRAIDRTPSLPRDTDGRVPPMLLISFRPNE